MARTNKMGILKKKQQQAKQKKVLGETGAEHSGSMNASKKQYENPKGNTYTRFMRAGKYVNDTTSVREDPDGYRIVRTPNSGEVDFKYMGTDSYGYRRWVKKSRKFR